MFRVVLFYAKSAMETLLEKTSEACRFRVISDDRIQGTKTLKLFGLSKTLNRSVNCNTLEVGHFRVTSAVNELNEKHLKMFGFIQDQR